MAVQQGPVPIHLFHGPAAEFGPQLAALWGNAAESAERRSGHQQPSKGHPLLLPYFRRRPTVPPLPIHPHHRQPRHGTFVCAVASRNYRRRGSAGANQTGHSLCPQQFAHSSFCSLFSFAHIFNSLFSSSSSLHQRSSSSPNASRVQSSKMRALQILFLLIVPLLMVVTASPLFDTDMAQPRMYRALWLNPKRSPSIGLSLAEYMAAGNQGADQFHFIPSRK